MRKRASNSITRALKERIGAIKTIRTPKRCLGRFDDIHLKSNGIPFKLEDYTKLVRWSEHIIRDDKRGVINEALPSILERLALDTEQWKILTTEF